jgi:hypothetical protein
VGEDACGEDEDEVNKDKVVEERVSITLMIHFSGCDID